ncbi:uncharacterized protein LOC105738624 [Nomascus leucogenys]|uniref:uncharacterized protein LOC105738624 n=1 Tax=Nomascus leucogenys TaxID=61853 RepID=UPI00122D96A9|nr:uncharacterized protein LOC105738624 [Nomascus leucogenys]
MACQSGGLARGGLLELVNCAWICSHGQPTSYSSPPSVCEGLYSPCHLHLQDLASQLDQLVPRVAWATPYTETSHNLELDLLLRSVEPAGNNGRRSGLFLAAGLAAAEKATEKERERKKE